MLATDRGCLLLICSRSFALLPMASSHELLASDLSWPQFSFASRREASVFARKLEERLASGELSPSAAAEAEEALEELLSLLFSPLS